jgi:hypothetical protein
MTTKEKIVPSLAYGIAFGTLFYILGGVANPIFASITPQLAGALGFASAVAINFTKKED